MKYLAPLLLVLAACGGSASPAAEPAPEVAETTTPPSSEPDETGMPADLRALVEQMPSYFQGFAAALEASTDCDDGATRLRAFRASEGGDLLVRIRAYPDLDRYEEPMKAYAEPKVAPEIERVVAAMARLEGCQGHAAFEAALDDVGVEKRVEEAPPPAPPTP